jgi:ribokinase
VPKVNVASNIRLKRVYEPASPDDGYRVLSTRYWPRGVPKLVCDEYITKTAPSRPLLREFKHEGLSWEEYVPRYLEEMTQPEAVTQIARLAKLAESRTMTLMCICEDERRCHRSLLKQLILEAGQER